MTRALCVHGYACVWMCTCECACVCMCACVSVHVYACVCKMCVGAWMCHSVYVEDRGQLVESAVSSRLYVGSRAGIWVM